MKNLFSGKLKSDQIFIKTIGSGGPAILESLQLLQNEITISLKYGTTLT